MSVSRLTSLTSLSFRFARSPWNVCVCVWVGGCKSTRCVFVSMRAPTGNFSSLSLSGGEAEGGAGGFPGEGEGEGGEASKRRKAAATAGPERWRGAATEDCGGCNDDLRMKATPRRGAEDVRRRRGYGRHPECAGRSGWSLAAMKALVAVLLARLPGNLGALEYTGVCMQFFAAVHRHLFFKGDSVSRTARTMCGIACDSGAQGNGGPASGEGGDPCEARRRVDDQVCLLALESRPAALRGKAFV